MPLAVFVLAVLMVPAARAKWCHPPRRAEPAELSCDVPHGLCVARLASGILMAVHAGANPDIVSMSIRRSGRWEGVGARAEELTGSSLPPLTDGRRRGMLDVGANIGLYSLVFAHSGYDVLAVEPMALNRAALNTSLCLNPHLRERVRVAPYALVAPDELGVRCHVRAREPDIGNGMMFCNGLCGGENSEHSPEGEGMQKGNKRGLCYNIEMRLLDEVLRANEPMRIDVVKMNIEGKECSAIAGGERVLFERHRPHMLRVETANLPGDHNGTSCVNRAATRYGYMASKVGGDTVLWRRESGGRGRRRPLYP